MLIAKRMQTGSGFFDSQQTCHQKRLLFFFMGPSSFFFFAGAVQADLALSRLVSAAQRRSMPCTLAHSSLQGNALRMN
jgi:hypothetical protein